MDTKRSCNKSSRISFSLGESTSERGKSPPGLTTDIFVAKYTGRGLAVERSGVLSKVQMLNLGLGVG